MGQPNPKSRQGDIDATALLTSAEMGRADRSAIDGGIPGLTLMENAGRSVAEAIRARWQPQPVLICCGPGNNGGDGFVAARHLTEAGWPVRLALLGEVAALKGDAAAQASRWDGEVLPLAEAEPGPEDLVVDALFGSGLRRPLSGVAEALVHRTAALALPVVAVDVPSGLSGDSGQVLGDACFEACTTVTFFRKKPGHLLLPGRKYVGELLVTDIGIPARVLDTLEVRAWENGPVHWRQHYPRRGLGDHKYKFGHALVVGGAIMTGAARLAAQAALRVGAGLVSLACPKAAFAIYAVGSPSIITQPFGNLAAFTSLLADTRRNAVLLGPGNGVSNETRSLVLEALSTGRSSVLDADALSVFQEEPRALFDAIAGPCVLTPHEGEFARIFSDLEGDKLARCRAAANRSGAVVLLKGADTVIAAPDGKARINSNAPPYLATGGSGDVLAGLVVGLLAQGLSAFDAASAAAWLHGAAAAAFGPGLVAEDLPDQLPEIVRAMSEK